MLEWSNILLQRPVPSLVHHQKYTLKSELSIIKALILEPKQKSDFVLEFCPKTPEPLPETGVLANHSSDFMLPKRDSHTVGLTDPIM